MSCARFWRTDWIAELAASASPIVKMPTWLSPQMIARGSRGMIVRKLRAILVAALASGTAVAAEAEPAAIHFKTVDRIGVEWAYGAFLQLYPTGTYADLARERITRLAKARPAADLSRSRGMDWQPRQESPGIDFSARTHEQNYGDAYFMRRHLPRRAWQR
jgi:hypothetical protein